MSNRGDKYINPFTDFGFKKLFGEEPNKDLLLDFLNELLYDEQGKIVHLKYLTSEQLGNTQTDRKAIFDLFCENEKGEKFIVELQKSKQNFFKDRSVYYTTFPIQEQAKKNNWNFELKAVYTIGILDFVFEEDKNNLDKYRYDVKLKDNESNKVFYDKLTFIYLEMPKFNKNIEQLETRFDKWMYVIKNLGQLEKRPNKLQEKIFQKVFETAEIAKFTRKEYLSYENSLKYYRDIKNSIDTARDEGEEKGIIKGISLGIEKGIEKGNLKTALNSIEIGLDNATISKITGLDTKTIEKLRKEK